MPDSSPSLVAKIVGGLAAVAATWAVQKAINASWKSVRGHKPPRADAPGDAGIGEVAAAAAITGALVAVTRVLATRGTATIVARPGHHHPTAS